MGNVLNSLRECMIKSVARLVLKWAGFETAHGWEKTRAKCAEGRNPDAEAKLLYYLKDHNLCGENFTRIYEVSYEARQINGEISV
jgi:hypothetical protein